MKRTPYVTNAEIRIVGPTTPEKEKDQTRQELSSFLSDKRKILKYNFTLVLKNHFKNEYNDIINHTRYLPNDCKFTERVYHILNNLTSRPKCACGKDLQFLDLNMGYRKFCSYFCAAGHPDTTDKKKQTKLKRYGDKNYCNKEKVAISQKENWDENKQNRIALYKKTSLENNGVEHPSQSKEIQEKTKQTNLKNHSVEYPSQSKEVREKIKQTCLKRYGVDHISKANNIKIKIKEKSLSHFYNLLLNSDRLKKIVEPLFSKEEYEGTKTNYYKFRCKKCNKIFEDRLINGRIPRCYHCYPIDKFTLPHKWVCEFLSSHKISYEVEKYINPYWVDVFISPNKIIEVNGDYWHGNPKFYKEGDIIGFPKGAKISVKEKKERDRKRIEYLKNKNLDVLVLWENEIKTEPQNTERKIGEFINK
jgi:G:T-mismatch repair DNA endonuclease (very short patch repair protein)